MGTDTRVRPVLILSLHCHRRIWSREVVVYLNRNLELLYKPSVVPFNFIEDLRGCQSTFSVSDYFSFLLFGPGIRGEDSRVVVGLMGFN